MDNLEKYEDFLKVNLITANVLFFDRLKDMITMVKDLITTVGVAQLRLQKLLRKTYRHIQTNPK